MPMCGGTGEARPPTADDQQIADKVRSHAEEKAGKKFTSYTVHSVKTQLVSGTNFFMKVDVGDGEFVHLRIYQTLPHAGSTIELSDIQLNRGADHSLEYF